MFPSKRPQSQNIEGNTIANSEINQTQAGRDVWSVQDSTIIQEVVFKLFPERSPSEIDWHWAERLIQEQQTEINLRLKDVLIEQHQIIVDLQEQPEQVDRNPLAAVQQLKIEGQEPETIDPNQLIIQVFGRSDIQGKLLILGAPGAGKTTLLLQLAQQLVYGALQNSQTTIPIIFELSTWKDNNQSIRDWLIDQLYDNYGGDRKLKRYEQWLDHQVLLPLLDGLDELGLERQIQCAKKLNEFATHYPKLIVCCRSQEYEEAGVRLNTLRGAVCLQPLSDRQIQDYLISLDRSDLWQAIQDSPEMRQLLEPTDEEPIALLRVPLFLTIAARVYDTKHPFHTKADLFEQYIEYQLSIDVRRSDRRRKELRNREWAFRSVEEECDRVKTRRYLSWLAGKLKARSEVDFLIEEMQPWELESESIRLQYWFILFSFSFLTIFILSLIGILSTSNGASWTAATSLSIIMSVFVILMIDMQEGGSAFDLILYFLFKIIDLFSKHSIVNSLSSYVPVPHDINLTSRVSLKPCSWNELYKRISSVRALYSFAFAYIKLLIAFTAHTALSNIYYILGLKRLSQKDINKKKGFFDSLINLSQFVFDYLMFSIMIFLGLPILLFVHDIKPFKRPGEGIEEALKFCFLILMCLAGSLYLTSFYKIHYLFFFIFSCIFCLSSLSCVKHFSLRFVLAQNDLTPWRLVRFLNYCAERRLLQRIGGRYRFIHRELLEHFAQFKTP